VQHDNDNHCLIVIVDSDSQEFVLDIKRHLEVKFKQSCKFNSYTDKVYNSVMSKFLPKLQATFMSNGHLCMLFYSNLLS